MIRALVTERSVCSRLLAKERLMLRYFFHVIDGRDLIDHEGTEFPNLRTARAGAIRLAGAILRDEGDAFWKGEEWHMNVTDLTGRSVLKLRFSADDQDIAPEEDREIEAQT